MGKFLRKSFLVTCAAGTMLAMTATTASAQESSSQEEVEMVKVWKVDFRGRPPFKRQLIELPAADVAAMEAADEIMETERVWTVDFKGKPPFRRRFEDVPVIDAASLDIEPEEESGRKKPLGSFKRHR